MQENSIRRAVREGRAALGTGLKEFASRGVPWIIEAAGFDYCMIDMEHGAFGLETIANLAAWFAATDVSPIVRIHKAFVHYIPLLLDQGIMGIQISGVDNADEARAIVQEAKYPPIGHRGMSGMGLHTGTKAMAPRTKPSTASGPTTSSSALIESLEGLKNVEASRGRGHDMLAYGHLIGALGTTSSTSVRFARPCAPSLRRKLARFARFMETDANEEY